MIAEKIAEKFMGDYLTVKARGTNTGYRGIRKRT